MLPDWHKEAPTGSKHRAVAAGDRATRAMGDLERFMERQEDLAALEREVNKADPQVKDRISNAFFLQSVDRMLKAGAGLALKDVCTGKH